VFIVPAIVRHVAADATVVARSEPDFGSATARISPLIVTISGQWTTPQFSGEIAPWVEKN
jgi:hypothetical protein